MENQEKRCAACLKARFLGISFWGAEERVVFGGKGMAILVGDAGSTNGPSYVRGCTNGGGLSTIEGFDKCISPREFHRG